MHGQQNIKTNGPYSTVRQSRKKLGTA